MVFHRFTIPHTRSIFLKLHGLDRPSVDRHCFIPFLLPFTFPVSRLEKCDIQQPPILPNILHKGTLVTPLCKTTHTWATAFLLEAWIMEEAMGDSIPLFCTWAGSFLFERLELWGKLWVIANLFFVSHINRSSSNFTDLPCSFLIAAAVSYPSHFPHSHSCFP